MASPIAICIHGGCGTLQRDLQSDDVWLEGRMHLVAALRAGWRVLSSGGSSVAAVEAAVMSMEESPHFNAGFGAVLNEAGEHELDASIMDGSNLAAGAVCAVRRTRHPVAAARAVMEHSSCVLIAGAAADAFVEREGLEIVENSFFTTPQRVQSLATIKQRGALGTIAAATEAEKHGTVGAAALDSSGTLAAATSTGGFTNKPVRVPCHPRRSRALHRFPRAAPCIPACVPAPCQLRCLAASQCRMSSSCTATQHRNNAYLPQAGRIGDSPIIGAGTYARNGACAVSGTGQGEMFIRKAAAHDITARVVYGGHSLQVAADSVLREMTQLGVGAGFAAVDAHGTPYAPYNTTGMCGTSFLFFATRCCPHGGWAFAASAHF